MICYPLETIKKAGIDDILIISGPGHAGQFLELLGSGYDLDLNLSYTIQEKPLGIAHAIWVGREFAGDEDVAVILGDNIIGDNITEDVANFDGGAKVFVKPVANPERFGIAAVEDGTVTDLVEKPDDPPTDLAVTGLYLYDNDVFDYIDTLELSDRNELEVTDLNRTYLEESQLDYRELDGYWFDAGTFEGLFQANARVRELSGQGEDPGVNIEETYWGGIEQNNWEVTEEDI
jgi:glucose-1-phosphate thymidylyltransferase